ncbi:MAG: diadenylate cyclase CdaA [Candidatus Gracilibacteria bacterium]
MSILNDLVSRLVLFFSNLGETFWNHLSLSQYSFWQTAIDVFLVAIIFYWLITLLKGTRAVPILTGIFVLAVLYALSDRLDLLAVNWILSRAFPVMLLSIPIIFQQELRRGLERLGKTHFFELEIESTDRMISDLVETCQLLAKERHGALIVLERDTKLEEYIETGKLLDSMISKELLLSIFNPRSPLHDGAVIIRERRIVAAGCILPHTFKQYEGRFGTRHKAAIGLSENSDAEIIIVSEERKTISFAKDGELEEVTAEQLQAHLEKIYKIKKRLKPHIKQRNRRSA